MSTAFRDIAQAVIAALLAPTALAGGRVSAPVRSPVPAEWAQHIEVRVAGADGQRRYIGPGTPATWTTTIAIDCYVRAAAGDTPDAALDTLLSDVHTRLQALDLSAYGVVQADLVSHIDWDWTADGATPQALASYQFTVEHDIRGAGLQT